MQIPPIEGRPPRFYHIHLQEDLLEGWTLIRESGQQGTSGRVTKQYFEQYDDALQELMKIRDQQLQRGYRIVFAMGDTGQSENGAS